MTPELRPAASLDPAPLAALFTAAYAGYVIPIEITEAQLRFMVDTFDIRLADSRVASIEGEDVGLANLAVRGEDAWIGGVGVLPSHRRSGIAEALMHALQDVARGLGVHRIWLEVIEQNDGAFRLYEKLGYEITRWVDVWSLPKDEGAERTAREVAVGFARARIRDLRTAQEPWQRADATLDHLEQLRGLETDGGTAVFSVTGENVAVWQIAGDTPDELLETLRAQGAVNALNVPENDPASAAFRRLGARLVVRQREMVLDLA